MATYWSSWRRTGPQSGNVPRRATRLIASAECGPQRPGSRFPRHGTCHIEALWGGETLVKVVTAAQAARASTGKKILSNLLKHDFPKNISSIVEAKRLGKHDDNSIRIHIAQGGCGYEVLRFFSLVPLHGRL
jgi:hypothetical protein